MAFSFDRRTGQPIETGSIEEIFQSLEDILTTPKGKRLWRRDYGSDLFNLIDSNVSTSRISGAIIDCLEKNEPRVKVKAAPVKIGADGITVSLDVRINDQSIKREIVIK